MAVLFALDPKAVPPTVVKRVCELIDQTGTRRAGIDISACPFQRDLLLEHIAYDLTVLCRPQVGAGIEQTFPR